MRHSPLVKLVEWLGGNEVRLFFALGKRTSVVEMKLPWVRSARHVCIVDRGAAIDPGDGLEVGSYTLWGMPKRVVKRRKTRPPIGIRRSSKKRAA